MNINIPENTNPDLIMRRSGYGFLRDRKADTETYVRRLGGSFYPRFHVYIEEGLIKLHLDQKQASYQGHSAHSGEYDGEVVAGEIERIKEVIARLGNENTSEPEPKKKKGFWGF